MFPEAACSHRISSLEFHKFYLFCKNLKSDTWPKLWGDATLSWVIFEEFCTRPCCKQDPKTKLKTSLLSTQELCFSVQTMSPLERISISFSIVGILILTSESQQEPQKDAPRVGHAMAQLEHVCVGKVNKKNENGSCASLSYLLSYA